MLDIIIVTYDKLDFFIQKNKKLFKNKNLRFIIIDNNNQKFENRYKNVYYFANKKNIGYGGAVNIGMDYCKSEYVLIANDDIVFNEKTIDIINNRLKKYKEKNISIIGFNVSRGNNVFKYAYSIFSIIYNFSFIPAILSLFSNKNGYTAGFSPLHFSKVSKFVKGVSGACFLIKRKDFYLVNGFDKSFFLTYEETDLFLRLLKKNKKIYYDKDLKVYHKHSITANKRSKEYAFLSMRVFLKKHYNIFIRYFVYVWIFIWLIIKYILTFTKSKNEIKYFIKK